MTATVPALVLCAGLGTRLRPLTHIRSKPAIPVAGVPMVRRIVGWLRGAGVTDIVVNLHHLPHTLTARLGDGADLGVRVRYSWEQPVVLGSAGGPRQALDIVGHDTFLIVNGDTLTDMDVEPLVDSHARSGAAVTLAVVPNAEPHRYGGVVVSDDGVVSGFVGRNAAVPSWHFIGIQVAHQRAFAGLPAGQSANSVGDVYNRLIAAAPGSIRAYRCEAGFWDVGTIADYWATSHAFDATPDAQSIAPADGDVTGCIVWDDVQFGTGCRVTRCIVTDGVQVEPWAVYRDSVLWRGPSGETQATPFTVERERS